jgi:hypothetical protein
MWVKNALGHNDYRRKETVFSSYSLTDHFCFISPILEFFILNRDKNVFQFSYLGSFASYVTLSSHKFSAKNKFMFGLSQVNELTRIASGVQPFLSRIPWKQVKNVHNKRFMTFSNNFGGILVCRGTRVEWAPLPFKEGFQTVLTVPLDDIPERHSQHTVWNPLP